jgi:hypothetical protein
VEEMPLDRFRAGLLENPHYDRVVSPVELSNSPNLSFHKPVPVILPAPVFSAEQQSPASVTQWVRSLSDP